MNSLNGFFCIFNIDKNRNLCLRRGNHENIDVIVKYLEDKDIKLDVLVGGPPCQGFSIAGPRDMNDKRNSLYLAMVKLAKRLKPQAEYPPFKTPRNSLNSEQTGLEQAE